MITKKMTVLDCTGGGFGSVDFGYHPDPDDESPNLSLSVPRSEWLEMGAPGQITLSIESGNRLNGNA
jgi:hypothetical protein